MFQFGVYPLLDIDLLSRRGFPRAFYAVGAILALCFLAQLSPLAQVDSYGRPPGAFSVEQFLQHWNDTDVPGLLMSFLAMLRATLVHGNYWHLFGNAALILGLGPTVVDRLGNVRYLALFFGASVLTMLVAILAGHTGLLMGASAAAYATAGAVLYLRPHAGIIGLVMVLLPSSPLPLLPVPFKLAAQWVVMFLIAASVIYSFGEPILWIHLTGLIIGYGLAWLLKPRSSGQLGTV